MNKSDIRKTIIAKRNNIKKRDKKIWDTIIFQNLITSNMYMDAKSIFIYVSYESEVDTIGIIKYSLKKGKTVYIPKTDKASKTMVAIKINSLDGLIVDKYGILEPKTVDKNNIGDKFDIIIMPGVAFDKEGNRIGYGGGYYDKYISQYHEDTTFLALAYNIQIVNFIQAEEHDITVNYILTEKETIEILKNY